jgi:acyl carrier protein
LLGVFAMSDYEKVKNIIVKQLNVDAAKVTENAKFIEDLGADSLDTVELVMAFEEEFNVEIPDEVASKMLSVKDVTDYIAKNSK